MQVSSLCKAFAINSSANVKLPKTQLHKIVQSGGFLHRLLGPLLKTGFSAALRCGSFSEKNIEKKHWCCHEKNYYYFWKSNFPVISLIVDSRNMIKVSKNMRL